MQGETAVPPVFAHMVRPLAGVTHVTETPCGTRLVPRFALHTIVGCARVVFHTTTVSNMVTAMTNAAAALAAAAAGETGDAVGQTTAFQALVLRVLARATETNDVDADVPLPARVADGALPAARWNPAPDAFLPEPAWAIKSDADAGTRLLVYLDTCDAWLVLDRPSFFPVKATLFARRLRDGIFDDGADAAPSLGTPQYLAAAAEPPSKRSNATAVSSALVRAALTNTALDATGTRVMTDARSRMGVLYVNAAPPQSNAALAADVAAVYIAQNSVRGVVFASHFAAFYADYIARLVPAREALCVAQSTHTASPTASTRKALFNAANRFLTLLRDVFAAHGASRIAAQCAPWPVGRDLFRLEPFLVVADADLAFAVHNGHNVHPPFARSMHAAAVADRAYGFTDVNSALLAFTSMPKLADLTRALTLIPRHTSKERMPRYDADTSTLVLPIPYPDLRACLATEALASLFDQAVDRKRIVSVTQPHKKMPFLPALRVHVHVETWVFRDGADTAERCGKDDDPVHDATPCASVFPRPRRADPLYSGLDTIQLATLVLDDTVEIVDALQIEKTPPDPIMRVHPTAVRVRCKNRPDTVLSEGPHRRSNDSDPTRLRMFARNLGLTPAASTLPTLAIAPLAAAVARFIDKP